MNGNMEICIPEIERDGPVRPLDRWKNGGQGLHPKVNLGHESIDSFHVQDHTEFPRALGDHEDRGETQMWMVPHPLYGTLLQQHLNLGRDMLLKKGG